VWHRGEEESDGFVEASFNLALISTIAREIALFRASRPWPSHRLHHLPRRPMHPSSPEMRVRPAAARKRTRDIANDRERRRMQQMSVAFKL
jgi:hypothetical protein